MIPSKLQLMQAISCDDKRVRYSFCMIMQQWNEEDDFFNQLIFGDESTFQLSGKINKHSVRIWGTENPRNCCIRCGIHKKLTSYVLCRVQRCKGHFYPEKIVTGITYLEMFSECLLPQVQ